MKLLKLLISWIIFTALGLGAYYFTFATFYEAWFPDYRDSSPTIYFMAGLFIVLFAPICFSLFQKLKNEDLKFGMLFDRSIVRVNLVVLVLCVLTFAYMSTQVTFLGHGSGDSAVYQLVPKGE